MFMWQNIEDDTLHLPGLQIDNYGTDYDAIKFDIDLQLYEDDDEIVGDMRYSRALYDRTTMERHAGYLQTMLEAMTTDVDEIVAKVDLLAAEERELLLKTWNATQREYPAHLCIHHLFEQQVVRMPDEAAVVFMDQSLSYGELNERANQLAHHLIGLGVKPDTRVAICVDRSLAMVTGVLAILKAGGAYVPIDPSHPDERVADILEDSSATIVLADSAGRASMSSINVHRSYLEDGRNIDTIVILDPNDRFATPSTNPVPRGLTSDHLAYIIYTSGSTGKPKGVMVEHRGVVNHTTSRLEENFCQRPQRVLQFSSLTFDVSVLEIFTALSSGSILFLLQDDVRRDIGQLWRFTQENSITQASLTPAVFQSCKGLPPLRVPIKLTFAGDALPASVVLMIMPLLPEGSVIVNEYGPTEATIIATRFDSSIDFRGDIVPIGRPIINKRMYILDKHCQPQPLGSVGELYIGGVGIARGYLNRPELTAQVFLPDPFAGEADARMYKTGDLAR
ncbi:hypothetical protein BGX31_003996, partial [Mortierella sp. GBA43]